MSHRNARYSGCPTCKFLHIRQSLKYTMNDIINECKNNDYDLPLLNQTYNVDTTKLNFKCKKHDTTYYQKISDHLQGKTGCKKCVFEKKHSSGVKTTMESMLEYCKQHNYDLPLPNQVYTNNTTKYQYRCPIHDLVYEQTWAKHRVGQGCPKCRYIKIAKARRLNINDVYEECKRNSYDLPVIDQKYCHSSIPIKFICKKHGIYLQAWDNHKQGSGCPECANKIAQSSGERFIRDYLIDNGISFEEQKKFPDLKDKNPLSYDFYLPDYNLLIEYNGKQHYQPVAHFGGEKVFKIQQYHDKLKADYAKDNDYNLIEISCKYNTPSRIAKYLSDKLKKLNNN